MSQLPVKKIQALNKESRSQNKKSGSLWRQYNLTGERKRLNHPIISYLIGSIISVFAFVVLAGVLHHLTISHHGPELLKPIKEMYLEEKKSVILDESKRLEELEQHRHFHHTTDYPKLPEDKRPVCYICHSDYPHSKDKKIRGMMNMHTQYFVCETCHIKEKPETTIFYKWYNPFEDNPKGQFFGTSYDTDTGMLATGDRFSKIAPYFKYDLMNYASLDKVQNVFPAIQTQDAPLARDFMKVRDKLSPEQRDGVKNKFHENVKPKGHDCKTCHSEKSIFDFKQLGFSENRISDLVQLEVVGLIKNYDRFYLPKLFQ